MLVVADLHLHSKYSRAVSQNMILPIMAQTAAQKGIHLLATSDFTHPLWFRELQTQLEEQEEGIYRLKTDLPRRQAGTSPTRFLVSTELSCIFTQSSKGRRIHTVVFAPSLATADKINHALQNRNINLISDGRPILGLNLEQLCDLLFSLDPHILVIPAHLWTPWYGTFGSVSGFNSLEEAFGSFAPHIHAIETGLSSDPAMNWRIKELDSRAILSFSDAHSPAKLGREVTVFEIGDNSLSYPLIRQAILNSSTQNYNSSLIPRISHTIEFYPEEGKYHFTGHRKCQVVHSPQDTQKLGIVCPTCGKSLTVGVMHRVQQLATRDLAEEDFKLATLADLKFTSYSHRPGYVMLVPLLEILAEVLGKGSNTQAVAQEYSRLAAHFGSEFTLLSQTPLAHLTTFAGAKLAQAVKKVRVGDIFIQPGYDGVFGQVKIWSPPPAAAAPQQSALF